MKRYEADTRGKYLIIKFKKAPSRFILEILKSNGYRYYHAARLWSGYRNKENILLGIERWNERCEQQNRECNKETLCFRCDRAKYGDLSGCPWIRDYKPVEGWAAILQDVKLAGKRYTESYLVQDCPLWREEDNSCRNG